MSEPEISGEKFDLWKDGSFLIKSVSMAPTPISDATLITMIANSITESFPGEANLLKEIANRLI